jgi:hypothetical protein
MTTTGEFRSFIGIFYPFDSGAKTGLGLRSELFLEVLRANSPVSRYQVGRGAKTLVSLRPLLPDGSFERLARRFTAGR